MPISDQQKAYIAALIDNFGNISIRKTTAGAQQPSLFLSGRRPVPLRMLAGMTETKVVATGRPYTKHRCTEHCPHKHDVQESSSLRWQVTGLKATIMLWNILPYMMVRQDVAREAYLAGVDAPFKGAGVTRMEALGWEIPADLLQRGSR